VTFKLPEEDEFHTAADTQGGLTAFGLTLIYAT
jgi:hypothetical protein